MTRIATLLAIAMMMVAAVGLYRFKDNSARQAERIDFLHAEIARERELISVLRAEWNYLNQPARIQELSERYLELEQLEVSQISAIDSLPMRPIDLDPLQNNRLGGFAGGDESIVQ